MLDNTPSGRAEGRKRGKAAGALGMALASTNKELLRWRAQLVFLQAGLGRPERICSANDIPEDLDAAYADGGRWVGAAINALRAAKVIVHVGYEPSARPARRGGDVKRWRVDEQKARAHVERLRQLLAAVTQPAQPATDIPTSLFDLPSQNGGSDAA